jgi:glucokinase-like ROK family protein
MRYCMGVDVGGTSVKFGLFETEGKLLDKWEIPTRKENHGEQILPDVAASILEKLEERKIRREDVAGVGMGIPAPVDSEGVVQQTANVGWGYKEVTRELSELLDGMRVEAGNDANVAAMGEMWLGAGRGEKNLVMVTLGTGVGGGVIVDGHMIVGHHGAGGEIGHICVNREEEDACGCGLRGCLEQYASATGIAKLARKALSGDHEETVLHGEPSAKDVFDAVKAGDALATRIADEFGRYLGEALASLAVVVDPAVFVIGGGVSKAGSVLIPFVEKAFREKAFFANKDTKIVLAELGNDAGICGAARLILN